MASSKCSEMKGSRSKDKAYIALIGLTGSGKSSTLNALFDRESLGNLDADDNTQTKFDSNTKEVIEYHVTVPVPNDKESTQMLIVIDTPGFHDNTDVDYKVKDSRIMATTERYLIQHKELRQCYPTAVLLVVDFEDERINEEDSYFIDFLKALEQLIDNYTLIDTGSQTCNLVLVLTKYKNARQEYQEYPEHQVRLIRGLIRAFTSIPPTYPVVFAENMGKDFKLPQKLGYFELPNGDLYPYNLFRAIQSVAMNTNDNCGASIIANAYSNPLLLKKRKGHVISLLPADDKHCLRYFYGSDQSFQENAMTRTLAEYWRAQPLEQTEGYGIFLQIAKAVFVAERIKEKTDMPKKMDDVLKLLQQLPVHPAMETVLRKLDIMPPPIWECARKVGCFYNITGDSATSISPFFQTTNKITKIGFEAPDYLQADIVSNLNDKTFKVVHKYLTREAYVSKRLACLKVKFDSGKEKNFNAGLLAGHNLVTTDQIPEEITGVIEYREYFVSLVNRLSLKSDYVKTLENLPQTYLNYNAALTAWGAHFAGHGTHVIQGAFIGGLVKVTARMRPSASKHGNVDVVLDTLNNILENVGISTDFTVIEVEGWVFSIDYMGGDMNMYKPTLAEVFSDSGLEDFAKWRDSLKRSPILLTSEVLVQHVSYFLNVEKSTLSEVVSSAANYCIGCSEYENLDKPVTRSSILNCNIL